MKPRFVLPLFSFAYVNGENFFAFGAHLSKYRQSDIFVFSLMFCQQRTWEYLCAFVILPLLKRWPPLSFVFRLSSSVLCDINSYFHLQIDRFPESSILIPAQIHTTKVLPISFFTAISIHLRNSQDFFHLSM